MRIGIDCRLWNETGVGRYTRNIVSNLAQTDKKNKYALFVKSENINRVKLLIHDSSSKGDQSLVEKFKIIRTDIKWHTLEEQFKFPEILNSHKLDLVHFPYFSVPIFYNKPFVVTIHDLIQWHFPTGKASTLPYPLYMAKFLGYKYVIKNAAQKAKKIIAVSNATKEEIVDHLKVPKDKIEVIYEGSDPQISNRKINGKRKMENGKYFLYVGNAYPHKNLERLIDAFQEFKIPASQRGEQKSKFKSGSENLRLMLVGRKDYFYKKLREKVSKMEIASSIKFYGEANDNELRNLYSNAKALVIPSLMEGFGLPALEAMASGCLVLSSDIPALREICRDAAVYFNPYDIKDISEKLMDVHSNDTYHYSERIKKGLERAKEFSWRKTVEQTLGIYQEALG